jgi:hypothetical protein
LLTHDERFCETSESYTKKECYKFSRFWTQPKLLEAPAEFWRRWYRICEGKIIAIASISKKQFKLTAEINKCYDLSIVNLGEIERVYQSHFK